MKRRLLLLSALLFTIGISFGQFTSVGILGDATPTGWDSDTDMIQSDTNDNVWVIDITLVSGKVKFRADDDWVINWGGDGFPSGIGTQGGPDIVVLPGDYTVTLNTETGAYYFDVDSDIGIIGDATVNGWDADTDMYKDPADENKFYVTMDLGLGKVKFRKDDDWVVNWGGETWPEGTAVLGGADIVVEKAGTYYVVLDTAALTYSFTEEIEFASIGLVGDATPGGWDEDTPLTQDPGDPKKWFTSVVLTDGNVKFRANGNWDVSWGGTDFPSGTASTSGGDIPVLAGEYLVTFNTETLEYSFAAIIDWPTIGLIGDATPGGWTDDTDMEQDANDISVWTLKIELTDGEAKFRANNDWIDSWGGPDFPGGVAEYNGTTNIPITAGEYLVTFNTTTREYYFKEIVEFDAVSVVGKSGPFGDWPGDDDSKDFYLTVDPGNPQAWSGTDLVLTDYTGESDSGIKFRAEADWAVNWGAADFPSGVGEQDGANIQCTAGTWNVAFNSETGEYVFSEPSSTKDVLLPSDISVYPNPASEMLRIDLSKLENAGNVQITVYNEQGQILISSLENGTQTIQIPVNDLKAGNYFMTITGEKIVAAKKFAIAK